MKAKSTKLSSVGLIVGFSFCPLTLLRAIEPPPDNSKPPALLFDEKNADRVPTESIPFIGLSTAAIPDVVAEHLGIGVNSGVIIRTICPDSPAVEAGLAVNDIILSINGTSVADSDAFSNKIRAHKVGDKLEIDLIRKGKSEKTNVILAERPEELNAHLKVDPFLNGIQRAQPESLRGSIEQIFPGFGSVHFGKLPDQNFENAFRMMHERMNRALEEEFPPITQGEDGGVRIQQNSTIRLLDNEGSLEIKASNGDTKVIVRDTANNEVWQGPWNTDKDKAAAPQDIRERLDRVNIGSANGRGLTFRFGRIGGEPDTLDN